ncbi:uncharacterized protein LOC143361487 isoform X2 [Halictus rubicundus]|uniref:uncharacterized protein LOC143361487 isoform X2 n=1 Tax=Halictus rubicundus TaxID=77578 RepID=UPI0040358418
MAETKSDFHLNGTNVTATEKNYAAPVRLQNEQQINDRTFSRLIFLMSLSIFLGKLYINYGDILQPQSNSKFIVSPTSMSLNMLKALDVSRMSDVSEFSAKHLTAVSEQFVNVSVSFFKTYGWLIKAAICGLIMTGFSWYIIYKDSSIPGIDPPSPFSPSKQRFTRETSNVQLNYLVGVLNGLLIFVYLCL